MKMEDEEYIALLPLENKKLGQKAIVSNYEHYLRRR
jgi:hypothetical protein